MKTILYIITRSSIEDLLPVIFARDTSEVDLRVLFTHGNVPHPSLSSYQCKTLMDEKYSKSSGALGQGITYSDLVQSIFEADLVITV